MSLLDWFRAPAPTPDANEGVTSVVHATTKYLKGEIDRAERDRDRYREALEGLLANIGMHHDGSCPGLTPADCLDAIYEAANIARAVLPSSEGSK